MNFAQAFTKVGNSNKYQFLAIAFMCLVWFDICYILLGPSYILMNPNFRCLGSDELIDQQKACKIQDQCQISNDFTLTAAAKLYCDRQYYRDMVQSSMYIGSISGLIIMNIISDKYGRKFSFQIALIFSIGGALFLTLGGYIISIPLLVIGQIFIGFGGYSMMIISYIIVTDICSDRLRQIGFMIMHSSWALAEMLFYVLYKALPQWQYFVVGFLILPLIGWLALSVFFLVESPVYLSKISKTRCIESLNTIAAWNDREMIADDDLILDVGESMKEIEGSVFEVFKKWKYLKVVLLISIYEITTNMFYYGTQYSMESIGSNFGTNMLIVGSLEFIAYFTSNFIIDKFRRKRTLMILNAVGGGVCLLFILPSVNRSKLFPSLIVSFGRFIVNYCQGFLACFMNQAFPDEVKSRGSGTIQAISNLGNIITPFIVTSTVKLGLNPVFVVSVVLILGIIPLIFTKETLILPEKQVAGEIKQSLLQQQPTRESIQ